MELFRRIFHVHILRYEHLCGANVITPGFRPHKWTYFWMTINASFTLCSIYTLFTYETVIKWKCLSWFGIGIQGLVKYVTILYNAENIRNNVEFLHSIYKMNTNENTKNYQTLQRFGKSILMLTIVLSFFICTSCLLFVPFAILENYITGKREPLLQSYLPFLDSTTNFGYYVLYIQHMFVTFLAGAGTSAVDVLLTVFVLHLCPMAEIFQNLSDTLSESVIDPSNRYSLELDLFFRNFILVHKEFCR